MKKVWKEWGLWKLCGGLQSLGSGLRVGSSTSTAGDSCHGCSGRGERLPPPPRRKWSLGLLPGCEDLCRERCCFWTGSPTPPLCSPWFCLLEVWEFPSHPTVSCCRGLPSDREFFSLLSHLSLWCAAFYSMLCVICFLFPWPDCQLLLSVWFILVKWVSTGHGCWSVQEQKRGGIAASWLLCNYHPREELFRLHTCVLLQ